MASIRERPRKDGGTTYAVLYTIDKRQSSLPFDDQKAAEQFKALVDNVGAARALEIHGIEPAPRRAQAMGMTVTQWLEHHIAHLTGVEQKTIDDYTRFTKRDINPILGDIPLSALTEEDISRWVKHLEATGGRKGTGNSPKSIKNKHGFLSGALSAAVPKHIAANPAAGRRLPRGEGTDEEDEMRMLSRDEFQLLLDNTTDYWKPLVQFLVSSGCRWGEAVGLKPSDINRTQGTVKVRRAWKHSSKGYHIGPPKTKRSKRTVDVDPGLLEQLDYSHEWVFVNRTGGPVRYHGFKRRVWDKAVARAGLDPKPTPHDLRHTYASWCLAGGIPMTTVSRQLGHENIAITVDLYADVDRTSTKAAAAVIADTLRGTPEQH